MRHFVGIDWASEEHAVCAIDEAARVVWRGKVSHTADGLAGLRGDLERLAPASEMRVAIEPPTVCSSTRWSTPASSSCPAPERCEGVETSLLRRAGELTSVTHSCWPISCAPMAFGRALAAVRRDEGARALMRTRDDLVDQRMPLPTSSARSRELLGRRRRHFADVDSPIALAFLTRYPTPQSADHLGDKRLAAFLADTRTAVAALPASSWRASEQRPLDSPATPRVKPRVSSCARSSPSSNRSSRRSRHSLRRSSTPSRRTPTGPSSPRSLAPAASTLLRSLPSSATIALASSAPTISPPRPGGAAAHESGKHRGVAFRWACNKRLRKAVVAGPIAPATAPPGPPPSTAQLAVAAAITPRRAHPRRAWLRVLWRAWQDRKPYDERLHRPPNPAPRPKGGRMKKKRWTQGVSWQPMLPRTRRPWIRRVPSFY